jgi:hypothetical protein
MEHMVTVAHNASTRPLFAVFDFFPTIARGLCCALSGSPLRAEFISNDLLNIYFICTYK